MKQFNKNITTYLIFTLSIIFLISCDEEKLKEASVIDNTNSSYSKLDAYLDREFVEPYNIKVQYRLNDVDTDLSYNVVPARENKSIQMINLIKYLCLDSYSKHSDKDFLKKYFPKQIMLVGSGAYNDDFTVVLGTAAGGVQIVLYNINNLDITNAKRLVKDYFNTIFHEFSHILHQKKKYTNDFKQISKGHYVGAQWPSFWDTSAVFSTAYLDPRSETDPTHQVPEKLCFKEGFISNYSSKEINEDFVEVISHYITLSDEEFENRINPKYWINIGDNPATEKVEYKWVEKRDNELGVKRMNDKLKIVKSYLQETWNINLDNLRDEVQSRLKKLNTIDLNSID